MSNDLFSTTKCLSVVVYSYTDLRQINSITPSNVLMSVIIKGNLVMLYVSSACLPSCSMKSDACLPADAGLAYCALASWTTMGHTHVKLSV